MRKKRFIPGAVAILAVVGTLGGCAGVDTAVRGAGLMILSPLMVAGGVSEGIASVPYTLATDLHQLNRGLIEAQATTLEQAYSSAYGVSIRDKRVNTQSGQINGRRIPYTNMLDASRGLQKLLMNKGVSAEQASKYVLCAINTHSQSRGHTLVSLVYRHSGIEPIRVVNKHNGKTATLNPQRSAWSVPYQYGANGQTIDEVIDWAGVENSVLGSHKAVGMLLVAATESILSGKRSENYWNVERRWVNGATAEIIRESRSRGLAAIRGARM